MKTQVLIVGAGPTGLMLANQLQKLNIDYEIIDLKDGPTHESRALAVTARSMELYQQLGLSDIVLSQAVELSGFRIFNNGKPKAKVDFIQSGKGFSDFSNFMNAFEQSKNEELLCDNLKKQNKAPLWKHQFVRLKQQENGVLATVKNVITQEEFTIEADYLVGCDGASSPVRKSQQMSFEGGTYENKFFVIDATVRWDLEYDKIVLAPSGDILIVFFPLLGHQKMRIIGTLDKRYSDTENIDFEQLEQTVIQKVNLKFDILEVGWHSIYKLHHRCVNDFRSGRVFLAGDSAHIHSPAGGQGMNTGLQDAHNLAWKLAMVLQGTATPELLNSYTEERLPFAQSLLKSTDRGFMLLASSSKFVQFVRKFLIIPTIARVMNNARFRQFAFQRVSQIQYNYRKSGLSKQASKQKLTFKAGDRLPYVRNGYYKQFSALTFYLICIHKNQKTVDQQAVAPLFPFEIQIIEEPLTDDWKRFGVTTDLYLLVRPDQYLLAVADQLEDLKPNTGADSPFLSPNVVDQ